MVAQNQAVAVSIDSAPQKQPKSTKADSKLSVLVEFIGVNNLAKDVPPDVLHDIGRKVKDQFDEDWESMQPWREAVEKGIKLMKQEFKTKSTPWEGATNYKSPMLSEAVTTFGDKASLELLRVKELVAADIIGKDASGAKKARAERVKTAMNYQVNYEMPNWRGDQKRLLYIMPNNGCVFKQTVYNPLMLRNESYVIQYPDFAVNQATLSMDECRSFTKILTFKQNRVIEKQRAGLWLDVDIYPRESDGDQGSNESEKTQHAEENPDRFLEQQTFFDLDGDGYEEPYVVTVHEATCQVVRIVARFDERSLIVKTPQGRIVDLKQAVIELVQQQAGSGEQIPEQPDLNAFELVRIDPFQDITKYGFIPAPDGSFLDLGYAHVLAAIVQGINATTNMLMDAGKLRNVGGGFMAKNVRKKMGPLKMRIGEWVSTELSPESLQNGFFPNPQPEPSQTLFALNEKLEQQGRNFAALVDSSGAIQANTAPTTALAIIQENLIPTSALMGRVLDAESHEFMVLYRLNQRYFDPEMYKTILDEPDASSFADFNSMDLDIKPTARPEMSSTLQRIQLATVELEQFDRVVATGGNGKVILQNYFDAIGTQNIEQIFPDPTQLTPEEKQQIEQLQQQQSLLSQQQEQQIALTQAQVQLAQAELQRLTFRTQAEVQEMMQKIAKMQREMRKIDSEVVLNLERAETEHVKNAIETYTASINAANEAAARVQDMLVREQRELINAVSPVQGQTAAAADNGRQL